MSRLVDADPAVIGPEYWNGVNIDISSSFDLERIRPPRRPAVVPVDPARRLLHVLSHVMEGDYHERLLTSTADFDPDRSEVVDGSVVVLERERLTKYFTSDSDAFPAARTEEVEGEPISRPFAEYWKTNQPRFHDDEAQRFGVEEAVYPDEHTVYSRELLWGIVLSRGYLNRQRMAKIWAFDQPTFGSKRPKIRDINLDARIPAVAFPLSVDRAIPKPKQVKKDYSVHEVERYKSVSLVSIDDPAPKPTNGKRQRVKNAVQHVGDILTPRPVIMPIPIRV